VQTRRSFERYPPLNLLYRVGVGVVGLAVVAAGIVMLPAPGPGWVVIFIGLGILATEFEFARRLLVFVRQKYQAWVDWLASQNLVVRVLVSLGVLLLVAVSAWLCGAFEVVGGWFGIEWSWLSSPLIRL
jgi:uncharacterized protein (TIGR02611 family)